MKSFNKIVFGWLLAVVFGLIFIPPVLFAQAENNGISIPREGVLPLGEFSTEKPPLFDVVSEPGQPTQQNTTLLVGFSTIVNILLILIVVVVARKAVAYFMTKKLKEKMSISTKK